MKRESTATFIGHNDCCGIDTIQLRNEIILFIQNGVTDFISGGIGGFDRLCARLVFELKSEYP